MKRFCFCIIAYNKYPLWLGLTAKTCDAFLPYNGNGDVPPVKVCIFQVKCCYAHPILPLPLPIRLRERELEVEGLIDRRLERNCSFNSTVHRWFLMQARHRECAILPQRALLHASADVKQIRKYELPCLYRETKSSFLFQAAPMGFRCLLELFFLHRSSYLYHSLYRCTPLTIYGN